MAKIPSKQINYSIGGVAVECNVKNITRDINQSTFNTQGFCDTGPRRVVDNYDWGTQIDGDNDFAGGAIDSVLWGLVGDADGSATILQPTGAAAGASDPNYTGSEVLEQYSIRGSLGQSVQYSARLAGSTALTRAVA